MERPAFTRAFVLLTCGLLAGCAALKPIMLYPKTSEIIIQEGEELKVECQSHGEKLHFSSQEFIKDDIKSNFSVLNEPDSDIWTFVRPEASYEDTGWYACASDDVVINNNDKTLHRNHDEISWVYIYVNSSEPFAASKIYGNVVASVNDTVIIPCRPTSPNLNVKLVHGWSDIEELSEELSYDPKIGFIISQVHMDQHTNSYSCVIDEIDDQIFNYPIYILYIQATSLTPPSIIQDTLQHVVWGQDLKLECTISVGKSSSHTLNWTTPSTVSKDRLIYQPHDNIINQSSTNEIYKVDLTVRDVHKTDEGTYTCVVTGVKGDSLNASTYIHVWDPNYTYINMSVVGNRTWIEVNKTEPAQWMVKIDSYPTEIKWEWYKSGHTVGTSETNMSSDRFSYLANGMEHFFKILHTNIYDNGNYTIRVSTANGSADISLQLTVQAAPIVNIHIDPNLHCQPPGESTQFSCTAMGSSLPNITWSYVEYPNFPSHTGPIWKLLSNFSNEHSSKEPLKVVSNVHTTINITGDLICTACNELGCVNATEEICVSDVPKAFGIIDPGMITQGDQLKVTCGANIHNYTDDIKWISKDSGVLNLENTRINTENRRTNFTSQSILHIHDVQSSDAGLYTCEVKDKQGYSESTDFLLTVQVASKPTIIYSNLNQTEIAINPNKKIKLTCKVEGMPIPVITWRKDNVILKETQQYHISMNDSELLIRYFLDADGGRYSCDAVNRIGKAQNYMDIKILGKLVSQNNIIWISSICALIVIIVIVIIIMGIKVHRERAFRKELLEAGLTHFDEGALECLNPELTVDEQAELLPYDKKWEFPRELLKLGKQLGSGAFGVVMKAEARGICVEGEVTTVAVKMVRRSADPSYMKALSSELKIMIHLGRHLNVVNLLGACTKTILTKRELYVIVEYCRFGNLHNYLQRHRASFIDQIDRSTGKFDSNIGMESLVRSESIESQNKLKYAALSFSRSISITSSDSNSGSDLVDYRQGTEFADVSMSPDGCVLSNNSAQPGWRSNYRGDYREQNLKPFCTQDLLCWAWQVSRGMEYLSRRNVLHGDLAARNILLADDNIVKICDFGLAKNMYKDSNYKKKGDGLLPIKWMAIESIRDRIFSTQSDVWSYGIMLWEFFTLARTPYPGMEAEKQYDRLIEGYRMEKPKHATDEIYDIMLQCWKAKPSLRPTFPDLAEKIGVMLTDSIKTHYCDLNTPYMDMNIATLQNGQNDYLTMMSSPSHDYHNSLDPTTAVRPDSSYLPMSPLKNAICDSGIFSPRPGLEESHFEFPSQNKNTLIHSDSEDFIEDIPMLPMKDPYVKPVDVQQRRLEFMKRNSQQNDSQKNLEYCNVPSVPRTGDSTDESCKNVKVPDQNLNEIKWRKNSSKDSSAQIIGGTDNYVNMPQQKTELLKSMVDSHSNPSYVIMTK